MEQSLEIKSVTSSQILKIVINENGVENNYVRDEDGNWKFIDIDGSSMSLFDCEGLEEAYQEYLMRQITECDVFALTNTTGSDDEPESFDGIFLTADEACDYAKTLHDEEYIIEDNRNDGDNFSIILSLGRFFHHYSVEKIKITLSELHKMLDENLKWKQQDCWPKDTDDKITQINKIIQANFNN